jgi:hypothetical protein
LLPPRPDGAASYAVAVRLRIRCVCHGLKCCEPA